MENRVIRCLTCGLGMSEKTWRTGEVVMECPKGHTFGFGTPSRAHQNEMATLVPPMAAAETPQQRNKRARGGAKMTLDELDRWES